jgi:hypothetical protein
MTDKLNEKMQELFRLLDEKGVRKSLIHGDSTILHASRLMAIPAHALSHGSSSASSASSLVSSGRPSNAQHTTGGSYLAATASPSAGTQSFSSSGMSSMTSNTSSGNSAIMQPASLIPPSSSYPPKIDGSY